jgi:hypothetical protein
MITDKHHAAFVASHLVLAISAAGQPGSRLEMDPDLVELFYGPATAIPVFEAVQRYKFTGESLYLRYCGKGLWKDNNMPWLARPAMFRLALTVYCANVPIIAAFIPPEVKEEAKPPHDPTRGFDSINHDSDNRGTIYDREDFGTAQGTGKPEAQKGSAEAGKPVDSTDTVHDGQPTLAPVDAAPATINDGHAGVLAETSTDVADVTENTDTEAELGDDDEDPHSGGDVVDDTEAAPFDEDNDDDEASGGEVIGEDDPPPPRKSKPKKRR